MTERSRVKREARTIETMIGMYCHGLHKKDGNDICTDCRELLDYAVVRLEKCPFQEDKTTCAVCPVHCYKPAMREKIQAVMRYAGPKMITRHPVMALRHSIDGLRKEPASGRKPPGS